jgi:hypothetical protein
MGFAELTSPTGTRGNARAGNLPNFAVAPIQAPIKDPCFAAA